MVNSGFTMEGARDFVNNLEAEMQNLNPSGLNLLHAKLGNDLTELQESLFTPFTPFIKPIHTIHTIHTSLSCRKAD